MNKKAVAALFFIILLSVGCSDKNKAVETLAVNTQHTPIPSIKTFEPTPLPTATPIPILKEDMSLKAQNPLTGLFISKEAAAGRPFAVVINNMRKAIPQSGISQADIIYEVLAEGDITRLIAIFQDFNSNKIGPVRSARDYFVDFSLDNDAVFVHHGGSPSGYTTIKSLNINSFDGMSLEGVTFWRDKNRLNQPGMYEHSSYTDTVKLFETAIKRNYRTNRHEDAENMFSFYAVLMSPAKNEPSTKITVPFSKNYTSVFEYDAVNHVYNKFQGGEKHIDEETGEQLSYTNIIIQFANMYIIPGDEAGRRCVDTIGSGSGYIITNGKYAPITWEKTSHTSPTKWYDEFGNKLKINKGKTWICVYKGDVLFE